MPEALTSRVLSEHRGDERQDAGVGWVDQVSSGYHGRSSPASLHSAHAVLRVPLPHLRGDVHRVPPHERVVGASRLPGRARRHGPFARRRGGDALARQGGADRSADQRRRMLRWVVRLRVNDPTWIDRRTCSRAVALAVAGTAVLGVVLWWLLVAVDGWADQARPATCLATRCFCEAVRDAPVAQPANTVSSFAYVLVGLWAAAAIAGARRATAHSAGALIPWLALVVALVGLSSAFYHATLTFLGQYFDVLSMYLLGALLLCGALVRMGALRPPVAVVLFVAIAGSLAVAQYVYPDSRRVLFALVLLPGILLEVRPGTSGLPWGDPRRVPLSTGIGLLVVAYGLWVLDDRGVLCWPDSLLQGHAAWHTLTAVSALMLVLHYGATRGGAPRVQHITRDQRRP